MRVVGICENMCIRYLMELRIFPVLNKYQLLLSAMILFWFHDLLKLKPPFYLKTFLNLQVNHPDEYQLQIPQISVWEQKGFWTFLVLLGVKNHTACARTWVDPWLKFYRQSSQVIVILPKLLPKCMCLSLNDFTCHRATEPLHSWSLGITESL